jgi:hypothetical protein
MNTIQLNTEQSEILNKSYDWATNVIVKQQRFLPLETMWQAYPFKTNGLNKNGLSILLDKMQAELINKGNCEVINPIKYI